jgi:hypothetical protein
VKVVSFSPPKITSPEKEWRFMNIRNEKNSTAILAGIIGLVFALVYVGLEFLHEMPKGISIYGDANTITVWHFPLIWLLAGILFYCVFYAARIVRASKVKEGMIAFILSVAMAAILGLFWLSPMLASLIQCFGGSGC